MLRYVALEWNASHIAPETVASRLCRRLRTELPDWSCRLQIAGLRVFCRSNAMSNELCHPFHDSRGVLLGRVFRRGLGGRSALTQGSIRECETRKILDSRGRHLIDDYWGSYVCIARRTGASRVWILRDPTGSIPCFYTNFDGVNVVFSSAEDAVALGLIAPRINWSHVIAFFRLPRLVTEATGIDGISQIHAGERRTLSSDGYESTYCWTPDGVCTGRALEDRQQAKYELRETVRECVASWASCYDFVEHELSGGLDSAIVLACLTESTVETRVRCRNFYTRDAEGDERGFARLAAERAGVQLVERLLDPGAISLGTRCTHSPVPTPALVYLDLELPEEAARVSMMEHHAVFSGQGGDHLFQRRQSPLIAAEYFARHGVRREFLDVVVETSRLTGRSVWSVGMTILSAVLCRRRHDPYRRSLAPPPFAVDAFRGSFAQEHVWHPWVTTAGHLPACKVQQIYDIVDTQNLLLVQPTNADRVHPLLSQPVIELSLRIPSYHLSYGGVDRALERDAFRELVPPEIIGRRDKGGTTAYVDGVLIDNLAFIREYMLGGLLADAEVLDRRRLEAELTEAALLRDSGLLFPILNALRAEIWLRSWDGVRARPVA